MNYLNMKQISKEQICKFRIVDKDDVLIHEFECKNVIKQIYEVFKKVLLEIDPKNTFDYAAFHAHYRTVLDIDNHKRRNSIRGYRLEVVGPPPIYSVNKESKSTYKEKVLMLNLLKKTPLFVYLIQLQFDPDKDLINNLSFIGMIKARTFTGVQEQFEILTDFKVKSKGVFNKYIQRIIVLKPEDGYENYKQYLILPFRILPAPKLEKN